MTYVYEMEICFELLLLRLGIIAALGLLQLFVRTTTPSRSLISSSSKPVSPATRSDSSTSQPPCFDDGLGRSRDLVELEFGSLFEQIVVVSQCLVCRLVN